jgi:hypothetical protein
MLALRQGEPDAETYERAVFAAKTGEFGVAEANA